MPKVAYSEEERKQIRQSLIAAGLDLMSRQGIQHTTVEQIYKKVGISRTFFYSFFPAKEDLIVETLYLQQPKIIEYAQSLMEDPSLTWRQAVKQFLNSCCYGEKNGIVVLTIEEQKLIFRRLSDENYEIFRRKQSLLFGKILECFGIKADKNRTALFTNLSLTAMIVCRAIPDTLPLFVPEVARETVDFQIEAIIDRLEQLKEDNLIL
ncbi:MAG: TetR/AcrR family transcriptional regulator [Firmicutes bacterium]|nr:TetR/AcrR family transcriptional regulator [Bacillota bacterium]